MRPIVLEFTDHRRPGGAVHVRRAAADVAKEGGGTKEVEVSLDVIPDLPAPATGSTAPSSSPPPTPVATGSPATAEESADEVLTRRPPSATSRRSRSWPTGTDPPCTAT